MAKFYIVLCVEKGGIFKKEGGIHTKAIRRKSGIFKKKVERILKICVEGAGCLLELIG